jgi:hypothetical protein
VTSESYLASARSGLATAQPQPASLADVLDRVLDKGIVIAGDIQINLLDIELLTVKLRLLVASVERAKEMGIDWWENDPALSSGAREKSGSDGNGGIESRLSRIEALLEQNLDGRELPSESESSAHRR